MTIKWSPNASNTTPGVVHSRDGQPNRIDPMLSLQGNCL